MKASASTILFTFHCFVGEVVPAPISATPLPKPKVYGTGVGKYLNLREFTSSIKRDEGHNDPRRATQ